MELQRVVKIRDGFVGWEEATGGSTFGGSYGGAYEQEAETSDQGSAWDEYSGWNNYLTYVRTAIIGTGGQLGWPIRFESMLESGPPTGANVLLHIAKTSSADAQIRTVSDEVAAIKSAFGLSISQLAEVLGVKRPTIYSWIDSARAPDSLRKGNRQRLRSLRELAETWSTKSHVPPGKYLNASLVRGNSLLDLLSARRINNDRIFAAMDTICAAMRQDQAEKLTFGERLRGMGFADRPSLTKPPKRTGA